MENFRDISRNFLSLYFLYFKGTLARDFLSLFFFSSNNSPKNPDTHFEYGFEYAKKIDKVGYTAVSSRVIRKTVFMRKSDLSSQCTWHSGVTDIAVPTTAVTMTPLWHAHRYHRHRCDMDSDVNDTAVTFDLILEWLWLPLKGISIVKTYIGKLYYTISITFTHKIWGAN
jgi:hypothetical protein